MSKRSFLFGTLVILAGLAAATPARAGSVITTNFSFATSTPAAMEVDVTYSNVGVLSNLSPTSVTGATLTLSGDVVKIVFSPSNPGPFAVTYTLDDTATTAASGSFAVTPSVTQLNGVDFGVKTSGVPEPATLALLGIGMTGLLAFRRFFKKTSVA
jgi:hypothetical protein